MNSQKIAATASNQLLANRYNDLNQKLVRMSNYSDDRVSRWMGEQNAIVTELQTRRVQFTYMGPNRSLVLKRDADGRIIVEPAVKIVPVLSPKIIYACGMKYIIPQE